MNSKWVVHKFGGTSLADARGYQTAGRIVRADRNDGTRVAVVVSAMSRVTDSLIELVTLAADQNDSYLAKLRDLKEKHLETMAQLGLSEEQAQPLANSLASDFKNIEEVLRGVWITGLPSESIREFVSGHGELWSAQLLHAHLADCGESSCWLDARKILIVEPASRTVTVDWELSLERLRSSPALESPTDFVVITGYIASTHDGVATTLKRNGSDFSASIFAALLQADSVTIWTDVDGVLSADPRRVPDAIIIPELSYEEAAELAYFGAKVVHPNTMFPAIARGIPIWIRNTFKPEATGTKISATSVSEMPVKGFATIDDMAVLNVEGTGMIGIPGVANKLFGALHAVDVSVVMISQASSEHSICLAVPLAQAELTKQTIEEAFFAEIQRGQVQTVDLTKDCCILAIVGDGMIERTGVAGKFFTALSKSEVNIRAIAQGSSERNISVVIEQREATKALRIFRPGHWW